MFSNIDSKKLKICPRETKSNYRTPSASQEASAQGINTKTVFNEQSSQSGIISTKAIPIVVEEDSIVADKNNTLSENNQNKSKRKALVNERLSEGKSVPWYSFAPGKKKKKEIEKPSTEKPNTLCGKLQENEQSNGREGSDINHPIVIDAITNDKDKSSQDKLPREEPGVSKPSPWLVFISSLRKKKEAANNLGRKTNNPDESRLKKDEHLPQTSGSVQSSINNDPKTSEVTKENDLKRYLQNFNPIVAVNNKSLSFSKKSVGLFQDFSVVLKDLVNGVPTAYDDLVNLLNNSGSKIDGLYESIPDPIKKVIAKLPEKVKGHLAPELLAVTAESVKLLGGGRGSGLGINLKELVSDPKAISSLFGAIMNGLKLGWPAVLSTEVLMPVALLLLLIMLWYCHKRGREERLKKETEPNNSDEL